VKKSNWDRRGEGGKGGNGKKRGKKRTNGSESGRNMLKQKSVSGVEEGCSLKDVGGGGGCGGDCQTGG